MINSGSFKSTQSLQDRFEKRFKVTPGCWLWDTDHPRGYGQFRTDRGMEGAHRVAYTLYVGPIPEGLSVLHSCDNPICVNPDHLSVGTQLENVKDRHSKKRTFSKLSEFDVRQIKNHIQQGLLQKDIAKMFCVSRENISAIKRNKSWGNIV